MGETVIDGPSPVYDDEYLSEDSEVTHSFSGGSFDGTNDLPEADQKRANSKRKARQNWMWAVRNINAESLPREEEEGDAEEQRKIVKELLEAKDEAKEDEEGVNNAGGEGKEEVILISRALMRIYLRH